MRKIIVLLMMQACSSWLFAGGGQEKETDIVLSKAPAYISPGNPATGKDTLTIDNIKLDIDKNAAIKKYELKIYNKSGEAIFTKSESNLTGRGFIGDLLKVGEIPQVQVPKTMVWPGIKTSGEKVPDGEYFYQLTVLDSYSKKATTAPLSVVVDTLAPDLLSLSGQFKIFSPNADGRRDTVLFTAKTGPAFTWTATVSDSSGTVIWTSVQTASGDTALSDQVLQSDISWDGSMNANGKTGMASEGSYTFTLTGADRANNQVKKSLPIAINFSTNEITLSSSDNKSFARPNEKFQVAQKASKQDIPQTWKLELIDDRDIVIRKVGGKGRPADVLELPIESNPGRPEILGEAPKDGNYFILLTEEYENGNEAESDKLKVIIDGTAPLVGLSVDSSPLENKPNQALSFGSVDKPMLSFHGFFEAGAKASLILRDTYGAVIEVPEWKNLQTTNNGNRENFDFTWDGKIAAEFIKDARYTVELVAVDAAGNQGFTRGLAFYRDSRTSAPIEIALSDKAFSPGGSKAAQKLTVLLKAMNPELAKELVLDFIDENGKVIDSKTFKNVPASLIWLGLNSDGSPAPDGNYTVRAKLENQDGSKKENISEKVLLMRAKPSITISQNLERYNPGDLDGKGRVEFKFQASKEKLWTAQILNAQGKTVLTKTWQGIPETFVWDGKNEKSEDLISGTYSLEISAENEIGNIGIAKAKVIIDRGIEGLSISTNSPAISPNKDGIDDKATFSLKSPEIAQMDHWAIVFERDGGGYSKLEGKGAVPKTYVWDGRLDDGTVVEGVWFPSIELYAGNTLIASYISTSGITVYLDGTSYQISVNPEIFSPDGDGKDDTTKISFKKLVGAFPVKSYEVQILDPTGRVFKTINGSGEVPESLDWDGKSDKGEVVVSAMDYGIVLRTIDERGTPKTSTGIVQTDILVKKVGDVYYISIPGIYFAGDESDLFRGDWTQIDKNLEVLRRLASVLQRYPDYKIQVVGHATAIKSTDAKSFKKENDTQLLPLSSSRAFEVRKALAVLGILWERMTSIGMGGNQPVVPHTDVNERWKNRRVEFILRK